MSNHVTLNCKRSYTCTVDGCGARHSKLLHISNVTNPTSAHVALSSSISHDRIAFIPFVQVTVDDRCVSAVLDTASNASFCSRRLFDALGLQGENFPFINTLSGTDSLQVQKCSLSVSSRDGTNSLVLRNLIVIDTIPLTVPSIDCFTGFPHLRGLDYHHPKDAMADLLIGQDNAEALIPFEVRRGNEGEPFAVRTRFGWSMNGTANSPADSNSCVSCFVSAVERAPCVCLPLMERVQEKQLEEEAVPGVEPAIFKEPSGEFCGAWGQRIGKLVAGVCTLTFTMLVFFFILSHFLAESDMNLVHSMILNSDSYFFSSVSQHGLLPPTSAAGPKRAMDVPLILTQVDDNSRGVWPCCLIIFTPVSRDGICASRIEL